MTNRAKEVKPVASAVVSWMSLYQLLPLLEETRDHVWLSKTCQCRRYTLRGVPAKQVDILIDETLLADEPNLHPKDTIHCTIVRKIGRFDGAERDRITIRVSPGHMVKDLVRGEIYVYDSDAELMTDSGETILCADLIPDPVKDVEPIWSAKYQCLKSDLTEHNAQAIVIWHWTKYYQHLPYEIAESVANEWAVSDFATHSADWTLAEANRSASRALYRASRDEGWRKLTMRERLKHDLLNTGQWQRADRLAHVTGCGEATLAAAAGDDVDFNSQITD